MNKYLVLILLIFIATFLRFYKIDQVPPSLSWDEVSIGYDAYSILKTGKDQWGESYPLAFKSFGEYKYPFHIYTSAISIYFFGLNEFAVRFPSAFFGVINILLLYLLVIKLFKNQLLALTVAFLLTISPWHIQFSRVIWETNFALFFFFLGLLIFLKSIQENKLLLLIVSFALFGTITLTYNAAKVFIVLFLPLLVFSYRQNFKQKRCLLIPMTIFIGLVVIGILDSRLSGINRFKQLEFEQHEVVKTFSYEISKIYSLGKLELIAKQYLRHFSPVFLFISGDTNLRHSTQALGQVYWLELPLVLLGIVFLIKREHKLAGLVLGWLLIAPIPGSFAKEAPHASRAMFTLGAWQILAASGLYYLVLLFKNYGRFVVIFFIIAFLILLSIYYYTYLFEYPQKSSQYWQYGYKQAIGYLQKEYNNYDLIVMTRTYGEPQIFTLFYLQYDPQKYQTDKNLNREKRGNWIEVSKFDKFLFPNLERLGTEYEDIVKQNPGQKILLIGRPGDFPADIPLLYTVQFLNGEIAFEIVEHNGELK